MNLTKEQLNLYTAIGSAVLLVIWLLIPAIKVDAGFFSQSFNMVNGLSGMGILFTIVILLLLLCPIYLILYSYKDKMPGLKPIFCLDRKMAGIVLAAVAVLFLIMLFVVKGDAGFGIKIPLAPAFGAWLYVIVSACLCYLGTAVKE